MDPELRDLLGAVATDTNNDTHSHVTIYGPHARWTIRPDNQTAFWTRYCELVDRKMNGRDEIPAQPLANMCLAERPQDLMPTIAHLTLKFHSDPNDGAGWEPYGDDFLQWICFTYQTVLNEQFRITSETDMEMVSLVLESSTHWYEEDRQLDQRYMVMEVRIQFPYCRIDAGLQNRLVRPRVIQLLRTNNILGKTHRQPIGDWEQIIAMASASEPVLMYGSAERPGRPKLHLVHIWNRLNQDALEAGIEPDEISLEDAFYPENHMHVQQQVVHHQAFDLPVPQTYWLPLFLSVSYWPTVLLPKDGVNDTGRFTNQIRLLTAPPETPRFFGMGSRREQSDIDQSDLELAERMIQFFEPHRFTREAFWLDVGKALHMADKGGEAGLHAWIRHTRRVNNGATPIPGFLLIGGSIDDTCRGLYFTFANTPITIRTLAWYALEDSPERYADWHRDWCMSSMEQALTGLHTDVAVALYRVYWLYYVYCPSGKGSWFQFKNHRWYEVKQAVELRKVISSDFLKRFEYTRMSLCQQMQESNDNAFRDNAEITIRKITSLIGKLKTVPFKSSIVTEACEQFSNDRFVSLLDSNPEITGVTNGVLEVQNDSILHRAAKPEDFVSMSMGVPFHSIYSWSHPLVQKCMRWFGQVFTDRLLLHHFLKFASSCLKGRNSDKIFPIFTGEGDNSKSMIVKLFESTFASYCIKFDISNVTGRNNNASGASPQLARAKATRVAFMDEPEDDVPMHKGIIKKWVGGDSFFARFLHDNGGDTAVTFKLVLTCNKVPIIPNADTAIKNRTRLFPFLSTWVDDPPEDEQEQARLSRFKKNPFFERDIPVMAPAFLWIMTEYYPRYAIEKLVDPPIVTDTTEAYWRDNDVYAQFASDAIQEVYNEAGERDPSARVVLPAVYNEFKLWFKDAFPGTKPPERTIVRAELSKRWGKLNGNAWHGIQIVTNDGPTDMTAALGGNGGRAKGKDETRPNLLAPPVILTTKAPAVDEKKRQQAQLYGMVFPFDAAFEKKPVPPVLPVFPFEAAFAKPAIPNPITSPSKFSPEVLAQQRAEAAQI